MDRQDDEKLWDLLGKAPSVECSPFFARNVLRRIREQPSWSMQARSWFSLRRLVPVSALAAAMIGTFFFLYSPAPREYPATESAEPDVIAKIDAQDYEVVADLDDLLAFDENSLWDDNTSSL